MGPESTAAIDEAVAFLASPAAAASLRANPYWPKWDGPWWHMLLLHELGLGARIPDAAVEALLDGLRTRCLHTFPLTEVEMPPGADGQRDVPCHCQLGTVVQVLHGRGVDVDAALPWIRPWFLRYQMADGGLNCDEAAYTRPVPRGSVLSTIAAAEAILRCTPRPFTAEERAFLDRATGYLRARRLLRSISKGMALIDARWLEPCFPRFYEYDALRGLSFLAEWAEKTGARLAPDEVQEAAAAVEARLAHLAAPRWAFEGTGTLRRDAAGAWLRKQPAGSFRLLEVARTAEVGGAALAAEWRATRARLG